jgi:hypothetical protein
MIKGKNDEPLLLLLPDLPDHLKEPLIRQLQLTFGGDCLRYTDSRESGEGFTFEAVHFLHYNRYSARVEHSFQKYT